MDHNPGESGFPADERHQAWSADPAAAGFDEGQAPWHRPADRRPGPRGSAALGWVGIILGCAMMFALHYFSAAPSEQMADDVGPLLMEIQGKYIVGASRNLPGNEALLYSQTETSLNLGSIAQRHRFVVLAAELQGPAQAATVLRKLDDLIETEQQKQAGAAGQSTSLLTEDQQRVHDLLHTMYDTDGWEATRLQISELSSDQQQLLREKLGWFGELALAPPGTEKTAARESIEQSASTVMAIIVGIAILIGGLGILGFIGLIVLAIFAFNGRARSGFEPGRIHHGLYAETFGIWMLLFPLGQVAAGLFGLIDMRLVMPAVLVVFFASLLVLAWPVLRGARFGDVKADIGWTLGRFGPAEPLFGIAGYAMGLPILAIGLGLMFVLMMIQGLLSPPGSPFDPAGGPAHPIVLQLGGPSIWPKVMILLLAAVAAPIVEETMFRGVLYRHLRDASWQMGRVASIVLSAVISGFIFAVVHPQGWVAVPALMSLSFAFVLLREWRGSVIPSMVTHAISNFLVMSLLIAVLSA